MWRQLSDDPFSLLFVALLAGLGFAFLFWSFNRTLRTGRPMKLYEKLMLSHGFLFVTGMAYLMAWNKELASFLHLGERPLYDPLIFGWGVVLLYDAVRRLPKRKPLAERMAESSGADQRSTEPIRSAQSFRPFIMTALRFLVFFGVIGAIGERSIAGGVIVAGLFLAEILLNRFWKAAVDGRGQADCERSESPS